MKHHRQLALAGFAACIILFGACDKNERAGASAPSTLASASVPVPALDSAARQRAALFLRESPSAAAGWPARLRPSRNGPDTRRTECRSSR